MIRVLGFVATEIAVVAVILIAAVVFVEAADGRLDIGF